MHLRAALTLVDLIGRHHDQHAQAEIEDVGHLVIVDVAGALDELEERRNGPGASAEVEGHAVGQMRGGLSISPPPVMWAKPLMVRPACCRRCTSAS